MACTNPIPARQLTAGEKLTLWPELGTANLGLSCGQCDGCRTSRSREWALRGKHEATQWEHNIFVTGTFNDEHVHPMGWLDKTIAQRFIKRLRDHRKRWPNDVLGDTNKPVRLMHNGEYGEDNGRPHIHALLFNYGLHDAVRSGGTDQRPLYTSDTLNRLWTDKNGEPLGIINFGNVTPGDAAGYLSKYTSKGWNRDIIDSDGVWKPRQYMHMSTKPPIGHGWLEKYAADLKFGYTVSNGTKQPVPRAYLKMLNKIDPAYVESILAHRERSRLASTPNDPRNDRNHPDRLAAEAIINRQQRDQKERARKIR